MKTLFYIVLQGFAYLAKSIGGIWLAVFLLSGCGSKQGQNSCQNGGTATGSDNQTYTLINGMCAMQTQTDWQNSNYTDVLICDQIQYMQGNQVCDLPTGSITSGTTGCPSYSDDYFVTPTAGQPNEQCWFAIKSGQFNMGAQPPNF